MVLDILITLFLSLLVIFLFIKPACGFPKSFKYVLTAIIIFNAFFSCLYAVKKMTPADIGFSRGVTVFIEVLIYSGHFIAAFTFYRVIFVVLLKFFKVKNRLTDFLSLKNTLCAGIILILSTTISSVACLNGFAAPVIKNYDIEIKKLPDSADGFTLVQLSDLHINAVTTKEEIEDIVTRTNALKPDLIVITGDFLDGTIEDIGYLVKELFSLKAKFGLYAVPGNHEYFWGYRKWLDFLSEGGVIFLENRNSLIKNESGESLFNLAGVTDKASLRYGEERPDRKKALKGIDSNLPIIVMSHRPKYGKKFKKDADLILTGHTHGGMMPGLDLLAALGSGGLVHDLYELDRASLIVSRGTRINMAGPLRIFNDPQIVKISLKTHR